MGAKMIKIADFQKSIDNKFWKHITRRSKLPFNNGIPVRNDLLKKLSEKISNRTYCPISPRGFIIMHKQNLVLRFVPVLSLEDYCVYYFCIKSIEEEIARNRVKHTYGGWSLGWTIRKKENLDELKVSVEFDGSVPVTSITQAAWKKYYTDYQNRAYSLYKNKSYKYFALFDIANFYDSIRLDKLEYQIRSVSPKEKSDEISLLFYFLSQWNKKYLNYTIESVGLPQDELNDCSRILANFYLQDYDKAISDYADKNRASYLRYADDQIIAARTREDAERIMFVASERLSRLGLNLNAAKAKVLSRDDFANHWSFDIFRLLSDLKNKKKIVKGYKLFKEKLDKKVGFSKGPVIRRFLYCNFSAFNEEMKEEILKLAQEKSFLMDQKTKEFYLGRIYSILPNGGKNKLLKQLVEISNSVLFNEFHLRVLKFMGENKVSNFWQNKIKNNLARVNALLEDIQKEVA
jgi:hypothetical protein